MFLRFLRWAIRKKRKDELECLREEVNQLNIEVRELREAREKETTFVNEDGDKVPMSKVISEYLYGKEEGEG